MPTRSEVEATLQGALSARLKGDVRCTLCGRAEWVVGPEFVLLPLQANPFDGAVQIGGPSLPLMPMTCAHCGNTHLLNLIALGLDDPQTLRVEGNGPA